jgi:DNA polymerase epsilon subunit 2
MLVHSAAGDIAMTDLSGSVILDMSICRPVPEEGAWFRPGMIVLVKGAYEEDGSNNSNLGSTAGVGGQIKGHFVAETMAGPPTERRAITIGSSQGPDAHPHTSVGAGFVWIDFLSVGSERAMGSQMRRIQKRMFAPSAALSNQEDESPPSRRSKIAILPECTLDSPRTLEAIRSILATYSITDPTDSPLSIIVMGNFSPQPVWLVRPKLAVVWNIKNISTRSPLYYPSFPQYCRLQHLFSCPVTTIPGPAPSPQAVLA